MWKTLELIFVVNCAKDKELYILKVIGPDQFEGGLFSFRRRGNLWPLLNMNIRTSRESCLISIK